MTPRRFLVRESREAMLVTADNLDEVAEWYGGQAYVTRGTAVTPSAVWYVNDPAGQPTKQSGDLVYVGDYLVTDGHRWWDIGAEEFERQSAQWEEQA